MQASAHPRVPFLSFFDGGDTTGTDTAKSDTARKLHFPIHDKTGNPADDYGRPRSVDLKDPSNEKSDLSYDPDSNRYNFGNKVGRLYSRPPSYMSLSEYERYRGRMEEDAYWQRRLDALMQFTKTPELPQMYKEGLFDRIFGGDKITVKPQGNVDVTLGGTWQNIKNPTLVQRAQKYGIFDFDMQMNINLLATVGDKLKFNISNNTKATFDHQNVQKIDYAGKEDEMLKKIEAGNISFPLKSSLISGVQSLFGLKLQLQFGKLWVTGVVSQQKSQRKSMTIQGGAQAQQFSVRADNYEENKNFLIAQYFRDHYNVALKNFPQLASLINITKMEVWITNRNGQVNGVREVLAFQDLGENHPYDSTMKDPFTKVRDGIPDNGSNRLYSLLVSNPLGRKQGQAMNALIPLGLKAGTDFEHTTARQLSATEFNYNAQLGYIMLHTQMNPDDILSVAFRYTYKGQVYQVGEFASDIPPDSTNPKVLFLKLLKGTANRPAMPTWKLMMKNVYSLGTVGVTKENFTLNVVYQDPSGGDKRYFPEGPKEGTQFISLLNLDRLNSQSEAQPDGVFDYQEGITIYPQQGKVVFPVLEPFGEDLREAIGPNPDPVLVRRYIYSALYDSTKTVAQQFQRLNRYYLKGTYKSNTSADIFLGGFNIPPGSVSVTAGGTKLVENVDYQIEYGLGRLKILNAGIMASGVPINVSYEDNSTFGFQQQNFLGLRFDYYYNKYLNFGGTVMRLTERPFTQIVNVGEDPIKNTVLGFDANFQKEVPAVTRVLDKLPIYSTTASSILNTQGEVAAIIPGHPQQINTLDPEGAVYVDHFEGASSSYDLRFPFNAWSLSSTPTGATNGLGQTLFPESALGDNLACGKNRARLAWYTIEPTLVDPGTGGTPSYVTNDSSQHYVRIIQIQDVFPNKPQYGFQNIQTTFDLSYFPKEKGPYNYDVDDIDANGTIVHPDKKWGGISRSVDNPDFEASNVEYIQFWMMDPFIKKPNLKGEFYINLGSVSEDILKDSRMAFENGIPTPFDASKLDTTVWGNVPRFAQQITRAFDNDPNNRAIQDVGYDMMPSAQQGTFNGRTEQQYFHNYLSSLAAKFGTNSTAYKQALEDPSNDDFHYYRGTDYDQANVGVLGRYKKFNSPENNSPITSANASYSTAGTTIPESEDINRDNTLNEAENYYQYRMEFSPTAMKVGYNNIINVQTSSVKLPNGQTEDETWYQFKIPVRNFNGVVGGISDFRSIRFIRMFLTGWQDSVTLRFATLELGRSQWRTYRYSLNSPGETLPQQNSTTTDFTVATVNIEENGQRQPVPYVIPPGVQRQVVMGTVGSTTPIAQNEQSLSLKVCGLQDGDARAVFKDLNLDLRLYKNLRMFLHCESQVDAPAIKDADVDMFIRMGSDFTSNYYEYRQPLKVTPPNVSVNSVDQIWPSANNLDIVLQDLVDAKKDRDRLGIPITVPYYSKDSKGNTIVLIGNPSLSASNVMLGVLNPKRTNQTPGDDGMSKCFEVWYDELRMAGMDDYGGYAASGKASLQAADLGTVNLSGIMHTQGYGNIDQKLNQRSKDDYGQYSVSTNLGLGKLMPRTWGVQLPMYVAYTQNSSTPRYNPFDQDVLLTDAMAAQNSAAKADSLKRAAQDFTSITSINFTNVKINGNSTNANKARAPWSIKNFDFSYSYNNQFKHNPFIELDNTNTQRVGLGYTYGLKLKAVEPFKKYIKSNNKWFSLIKEFNFTPLPNTITFRSDVNRMVEETRIRNFDEGGNGFHLPSTFYKLFTWNRNYTLRWDPTKSISLDYSATNISRIDEPYGRINTNQKRDSLIKVLETFGKNTSFQQTFNASYTLPFAKLPITDWISVKATYNTRYNWLAAMPVAYDLGNTIGNNATKQLNGDFNLKQLYTKWRWLRALDNQKPGKAENKKEEQGKPGEFLNNTKGGGGPKVGELKKLPGSGPSFGDVDDGGAPPKEAGSAGPGGGPSAGGPGGSPGALPGGQPGGNQPGSGGAQGGGASSGGATAGGGTGNGGTGNGSGATPGGSTASTTGGAGASAGASGAGTGSSGAGTGATGTGATPGSGTGTGGGKNGGSKGTGGSSTGTGGSSGSSGKGGSGGSTGTAGSSGYTNVFDGIDVSSLTEDQMDSLLDVQKKLDKAHRKAERKKKRAERRAKRKARRAKLPELNEAEIIGGKILTMATRATVTYSETEGTTLPGYMDSTRFMGINNYNGAPGLNFVYGYQPDMAWLYQKGKEGKLTHDSMFNAQFQQTYSQNLSATATLAPVKDMKIDLNLTKTFTKAFNVLYKDTGTGDYHAFDPYQSGSFSITYVSIGTMFKNTGVNSDIYKQFLSNREIISTRLGNSNPYTNSLPDPQNPRYKKGYGEFSQDVLVPAFIAAYTGNSANDQALIDHSYKTNVTDNPFKYFYPMPNWKINYMGLGKLPGLSEVFTNLTLNSNYTGTMAMNSFNSNLFYNDLYTLGFPSFIDSNSHNYVPYFQVPNITITQQFAPLIGIDAQLKNHLTAKFEFKRSKTTSLSLIDYQVSMNNSTEYVIGIGWRKKGVKLPFKILGVQKLENELIFKMDIGLRDDKTENTFLANNISVTSRGQQVIRISPSIDYAVRKNITLHFFFDRQQTIPYVSSSYPTSTTKGGLTFRFLFAQ